MRRSTGRSPWSRKTRRAPPEGTPVNERRAGSSRPTGQAVSGTNGRMISAPTEWAVTRRLRGAPRPFGGRHRRRPGGPGRYNAAAVRACRVIDAGPQGAAAPVTKPKKVPGVDARPVLALSVQLSAAMNPRIGGSRVGEAPRPFFPPISLGRNGGARRAGIRREAGPPPDGRILSAPTGLAVGVPRWSGPPPGDAPVSGQKSAPPGIRAALVFTALRGNTPNQGWQAAACRGCCAGR